MSVVDDGYHCMLWGSELDRPSQSNRRGPSGRFGTEGKGCERAEFPFSAARPTPKYSQPHYLAMKRPRQEDAECDALASPHLYHLHAAYTALLTTGQPNSAGLPILSSIHARRFLSQLDGESGSDSNSRVVLPSASTIAASREALPVHWIQHNALCSRCGGVCIPGVSWSFGHRACLNCYDGGRAEVSKADLQTQKASKARFASVRKRKRGGGMDSGDSIIADSSKGSATSTPLEKTRDLPVTSMKPSTEPQRPQLDQSKPESMSAKPQPPVHHKATSHHDNVEPKRAQPPAKPKPINATSSTRQHDHKAALRSLLMKDAKKKKGAGVDGEEKKSGSGGGLRDFLADL